MGKISFMLHHHRPSFSKEDATTPMSTENRIALLAVLRNEWMYRDKLFVSQFWRFTYISLIVAFLPNFSKAVGIMPDIIGQLPPYFFPAEGFLFSLLGFFISIAENQRVAKLDEAYQHILDTFPCEYTPQTLPKPQSKEFSTSFSLHTNILLCFVGYGLVAIISLINLLYSYL